jgi:hypothetical protein
VTEYFIAAVEWHLHTCDYTGHKLLHADVSGQMYTLPQDILNLSRTLCRILERLALIVSVRSTVVFEAVFKHTCLQRNKILVTRTDPKLYQTATSRLCIGSWSCLSFVSDQYCKLSTLNKILLGVSCPAKLDQNFQVHVQSCHYA